MAKRPTTDYKVFTRKHDVVLDAKFLADNPTYPPFDVARAQPMVPSLASEAQIAETILDFADVTPDLSAASVTVLLDQSGSQRGTAREGNLITMTDRMVQALEHAGAEVEVLGFTTMRWKGGKSREDWLKDGRKVHPGRLNDLLHIVYKTPDARWDVLGDERSPRRCLDLIFREPYMREGIDGEAVEWATERLRKSSRERKILLTVSDCAPVDDSTMAFNRETFLGDHLRSAVRAAEAAGITVLAINNGTKYSTKEFKQNYYDNVVYGERMGFNGKDAATAALKSIAEIAVPKVTPTP